MNIGGLCIKCDQHVFPLQGTELYNTVSVLKTVDCNPSEKNYASHHGWRICSANQTNFVRSVIDCVFGICGHLKMYDEKVYWFIFSQNTTTMEHTNSLQKKAIPRIIFGCISCLEFVSNQLELEGIIILGHKIYCLLCKHCNDCPIYNIKITGVISGFPFKKAKQSKHRVHSLIIFDRGLPAFRQNVD